MARQRAARRVVVFLLGRCPLRLRAERMKSACIPFSEIPQTTHLFSTYLTAFDRLAEYYSHPPTREGVAASAREVNLAPELRSALVEILRQQNRRFGCSQTLDPAAEKSLQRLAGGAVAIVSGQQVGLFSGPALTIYKALSTIHWAEEMTRAGVDAVPVFWLATQDHDLAEVNESFWNTRNGAARYELPKDPESEGKSVGKIPLGSGVQATIETAAQTLDGPAAAEVAAALRESYAPDETYGSAFGKLLARIFAGRGILFIDPQSSDFDRLAAPIYRTVIESGDELREALLARSHALEEAGYHAQVKVTRESTLLFCSVEGRREPLRTREGGGFSAGAATFSKSELLARLQEAPGAFSASALLRPALQDTILPTAALIGGPAEIAYLAQSQAIYQKVLGRMPAILPRASFTLVEPPIARFLEQYGLDIRDLFQGRQRLRVKMEQESLPDGLTGKFESDEHTIRQIVKSYREPLERLDATLVGAVESIEEKIAGYFLKLKEKVGRAENFRTGVLDRHERILLDALYMNHALQERHLSILPHLANHGLQVLDELLRHASSCAGQHQVLFLD
jgi:bacillithiol biosynthesis cysteine-adding enzyme BshC